MLTSANRNDSCGDASPVTTAEEARHGWNWGWYRCSCKWVRQVISKAMGASLTEAASSPRTCVPFPPWTSWWSVWSSWSGSPWRPGSTRSPPESPFYLRSETRWCAGAGRCLAAGPGCTGGCSSEPIWGFDTSAPPAWKQRMLGGQWETSGYKKKKQKNRWDWINTDAHNLEHRQDRVCITARFPVLQHLCGTYQLSLTARWCSWSSTVTAGWLPFVTMLFSFPGLLTAEWLMPSTINNYRWTPAASLFPQRV